MPTSCETWNATNHEQWQQARAEEPEAMTFQEVFSALLKGDVGDIAATTIFGNFIMIHVLVQKLLMLWHGSIGLPVEYKELMHSTAFESYILR